MTFSAIPRWASRTISAGVFAAVAAAGPAHAIDYGVELPDPGIPGYHFPEPETTLNRWVSDGDWDRMYNHSWGLWASLTAPSGQSARGVQDAPVYLTWLTPGEILTDLNRDAAALTSTKERPLTLEAPRQFDEANAALADLLRGQAKDAKTDTSIVVTVNYSPAAARHAFTNKLVWKSTLQDYLDSGYAEIPTFPVQAVTVKPVYKVITKDKLRPDGLYSMPAWPGTPVPAKTFPEQDWGQCVYVDLKNGGKGDGSVDPSCDNPTPQSTYNLDDLIHIEITKKDQAAFQDLAGGQAKLQPGDYVILVGMHVTTREMTQWVWQTFWWTPSPASPQSPSSKAIADAMPSELTGPAAHYAMAVAYQMLVPAQPVNGGENVGDLLAAYNPYLEAGFDPSVFQIKRVVTTQEGKPVVTKYGVQTNCMTCHGLAAYDPLRDYDVNNGVLRQTPYASNFYLPLDDPEFRGKLKLDFAWSLLGVMDSAK